MTTSNPTTRRPSICTTCMATRGEDPTDPKASAPYKYPALTHEPRIQELHDDWQKCGYQPVSPAGRRDAERRTEGKSSCIRCSTCDGFPCLVGAKADSQVVCVDPALQYPNVTMVTHALVTRLETNGTGREISPVHGERNGEKETYRGNIVVVSCWGDQFGGPAIKLCQRTASQRPGELLRPGRPSLHVPQQFGHARDLEAAEQPSFKKPSG